MYYNSAGTLCQYIYRKWADVFAFLCSLPEGTKKETHGVRLFCSREKLSLLLQNHGACRTGDNKRGQKQEHRHNPCDFSHNVVL